MARLRTEDKHVQTDAQGPDVGQPRLVGLATAHLGGHEGGRPGRPVDEVADACQLGATEVRDLDVAVRGQQEVVGLQISVGNFVLVKVVEALDRNETINLGRFLDNPGLLPGL